jgi:hypothetical protein
MTKHSDNSILISYAKETQGSMNIREHQQIRQAIISLLDKRDMGKTICPSEASRAVFGSPRGNDNACMDRTRHVVAKLVDEGVIEVCQKGKVVDLSEATGPIRLRKCRMIE